MNTLIISKLKWIGQVKMEGIQVFYQSFMCSRRRGRTSEESGGELMKAECQKLETKSEVYRPGLLKYFKATDGEIYSSMLVIVSFIN